MYLLNSHTNGKTIKSINRSLYHGTLINRNALSSRRRPWDGGSELICALNAHGGPRVRMLSVQFLVPHTLIDLFPKNSKHESRKVDVRRWYSVNDRQSFSHIYADLLYKQDSDQYVDNYYLSLPEINDPGIAYYELIVTSINDYSTHRIAFETNDLDTHQYTYNYPLGIEMPVDVLDSQSVATCMGGYLLADELFHSFVSCLDREYYKWRYYAECK